MDFLKMHAHQKMNVIALMVVNDLLAYGAKVALYANKIASLVLLACLISCSSGSQKAHDEVEVIDVNPHLTDRALDKLYGKYVSEVKVVSLETTDKSLLRAVSNVFFSDSLIYVMAPRPRQIYIFDFDGKFVNKLLVGNGPGEIADMRDADFDAENNELIVFQQPKIMHYTPTGYFLRNEDIPYHFSSMKKVPGGFVLTDDGGCMCEKYPEATVLYVDNKFKPISAHLKSVEKVAYGNSDWGNFNRDLNVAVVPTNEGTIYFLDRSGFVPKYYLDFSSDRFDDAAAVDMEQFSKGMSEHYSFFFYHETSSHQYFGLSKVSLLHVFRDKANGAIVVGKGWKGDFPFEMDIRGVYNDYFVSVQEFSDQSNFAEYYKNMLSPDDLAKIRSQKEDDNPLLVFFKLKPFDDDEK